MSAAFGLFRFREENFFVDKNRTEYSYDVLGRRMQKAVWDRENQTDPKKTFTRRYVYDGDNIFAEYDSNNSLLARYTHSPLMADDVLSAEISSNGVVAGLAQNSGKFYYLKDALGTVTDIVDASGAIVVVTKCPLSEALSIPSIDWPKLRLMMYRLKVKYTLVLRHHLSLEPPSKPVPMSYQV